ncbi:nuclear elongation and deformation protein 1 [Aspergillus udagawae]|uniref:Nuclear elongation and deformation protein 1 n=1 Tax=Aspergillus udagawae TaxID=91492 RepID=A0ABQ0ZZ62_9EURO|nr:nuclear elongation and deformation protein 1 [Aspergillus udagawae]GFF69722.1 nuclear elongation and deformation protein 1 [Aspergillus udagawae]GFG22725.1 nuclear elongation and deformation protein 1 [Aspergillus udagawae]
MQYVRSISGSVSKTWNSINPATLSGAIDVIVIEQEDGTLACSPFHVRFGKFSLLRPYEKKVEFQVNGVKQDYAMKLGEGGEAFFVFETSDEIPASLQTSPLVSPAASPRTRSEEDLPSSLQEPEFLDLEKSSATAHSQDVKAGSDIPLLSRGVRASSDLGAMTPLSQSPDETNIGRLRRGSLGNAPGFDRAASEPVLIAKQGTSTSSEGGFAVGSQPPSPTPSDSHNHTERPRSPLLSPQEAVSRALSLSKKLSSSNIPTRVNETGDLMLDMTGYKSNEEDALRAELIARKILAEELEGSCDIGGLIGADEHGNLWIYSSEEAKEAANRRATFNSMRPHSAMSENAISDPGYHSDTDHPVSESPYPTRHHRAKSDVQPGFPTPPQSPTQDSTPAEQTRNYAKTLRLTSDQLKALNLKPGANPMSFSVNRATCTATMYLWNSTTPIVISDIDGTITKSDALGHVLNMIGRDWTHAGVAKLYTDIVNNGYNIMYLTSRSVGQADTTRTYIYGVRQDGYRLPKGPVIMSPDRTIAALRREIYLRKPEVFKMACLRDILGLFNGKENPFYAGFGNRLTDALSYRSVNIPSTRIFTINSNAEVSLDLLSLNKYKSSYVTMQELLDHFFPPVSLLVQPGGENCTDFTYWREAPQDVEIFSDTDSDEEDEEDEDELDEEIEEEEEEEYEGDLTEEDGSEIDEEVDELGESYISQESMDGLRLSESNASLAAHGSTQVEEDEDENADDMVAETKLLNSRFPATSEPVRSA